MKRLRAAALALAGWLCACSPPATVLDATASQPRAFGWRVGDIVEREVVLQVPPPLELDTESLPRGGGRGRALELHDLHAERRGDGLRLLLRYQVMLSPPQVRTLEIAPLRLRFRGGGQEREVRVEGWPLTVAPLVPVDVAERTGLGDMRPDAPPPHVDEDGPRRRLAGYATAAAAVLLLLAHVYIGLPWWGRHRRPMAQAWRALRALPPDPDPERSRAALARVHEALNRSAGRVLFEGGVNDFVGRHPRFAPLADDLADFFRRSRTVFFADPASGRVDGRWLVGLCRRLRDAERGSGP